MPFYIENAYKIIVYLDDELIGQTESQDGINIHFSTSFVLDFYFEINQKLKFTIKPSNNTKIYNDELEVHKLMKSKNMSYEKTFFYLDTLATFSLFIHAEPCNILNDKTLNYRFQDVQIIGLNNAEHFKLFFDVLNFKDNKYWRPMYQSETVTSKQNPSFKDFNLNKDFMSSGNLENKIKIVFYDQESGFLGDAIINIKNLLVTSFFQIFNDRNIKICAIQIKMIEFREVSNKQILDSIKFHSIIAIDFTESNGLSSSKNSLHYIEVDNQNSNNSNKFNNYESAIKSLGTLIENFNSFVMIPLFSFGGISPVSSIADFCCDMNTYAVNKESVSGIQGVLNVYRECVKIFLLSGPTNLKPVFEHVLNNFIYIIKNNPYNYYIVWVFINSDLDDIKNTETILENCGNYGISIIICGVGKDKFLLMNNLSEIIFNFSKNIEQ